MTMSSEHSDNAMTEVALALAMAFFSILTLNLMSIGSGQFSEMARPELNAKSVEVALADNGGEAPRPNDVSPAQEMPLVIYFRGDWFDRNLKQIDPSEVKPADRIFMAVEDTLRFSEAVAARERLSHLPITLVALNQEWIKALRRPNP